MPAFAAGGDRTGAHFRAELDHRDKAVAAAAVIAFGAGPAVRAERGQRTPARGDERHRDARPGVVERLHDGAIDALEAIDLAPRPAPTAELVLQSLVGCRQGIEPPLRAARGTGAGAARGRGCQE